MISLILSSLLAISIPLFIYSGIINSCLQTSSINLSNDFITGMIYCFVILLPIIILATKDYLKNNKIKSDKISFLNNQIIIKDTEISALNKELNNINSIIKELPNNIVQQLKNEFGEENRILNERLNHAADIYRDQRKTIKSQANSINELTEKLNEKINAIVFKRKQASIINDYLKSIKYSDGHSVFDDVNKITSTVKPNPTPKKQRSEFHESTPMQGKHAKRCQQNKAMRAAKKATNDNIS